MKRPLPKYYFLLFLFFSVFSYEAFSQKGFGELYDFNMLENGDTLRVSRGIGDWWFGFNLGGSTQLYFGNIYIPRDPAYPTDEINPALPLTSRIGMGYQPIGASIEYNPQDARYGFGIKGSMDNRSFTAESEPYSIDESGITKTEQIKTKSDISYYSISPFIRYNLYDNFYLTLGADVEISRSITKQHITSFTNPDPIEDTRPLREYLNKVNTRYALNFGVGYDINVVDFNQGNRIFVAPFIQVSAGTNIFGKDELSQDSPNFNNAVLKLGVSIKYSRDARRYDTLRLDSTKLESPSVLLTAQVDQGVSYSGFQKQELIETPQLSYVDVPEFVEQIREEPILAQEMAKDTTLQRLEQAKAEEKVKPQNIEFQKTKTFSFPTQSTVALTNQMKEYLNSVALFLKSNPNAKIEIEGHADNRGTPDELRNRSVERAEAAKKYLILKGVSVKRILSRGSSANKPVATNDTESGRRQNRRIEIRVREK